MSDDMNGISGSDAAAFAVLRMVGDRETNRVSGG
jgi:hypothetical protein